MTNPTPLLVIGCSVQKASIPGPAFHVYRGPLVQLGLRYAYHRGWIPYILSARYGLIRPEKWIEPYDERALRNTRLLPDHLWPSSLGYWLGSSEYFKMAPPNLHRLMPPGTSYGEQKGILQRWLKDECWVQARTSATTRGAV